MNKRKCDHAVEKIYYYLDGEITWYSRMRISWHLRSCPPCEGAYSFEDKLRDVVREKSAEEVPAALLERLRSALREDEGS
jgi:mycothiol system anti-sigma-R factor